MASATEAELVTLFLTARKMVPLCQTLIKMGWPQPKKTIQTDNSTAVCICNNTIIAKQIKIIDMLLNWLQCRESQDQFRNYYDKDSESWADYST